MASEKDLIKKCPFCGLGKGNLYLCKEYIGSEYGDETEIFCNNCKITFRREDDVGDEERNLEKLIEHWNKPRAKTEREQALEIIVNKDVDVEVIKTSNNVIAYNFETRFIRYHELTQEEYDLVSKVVKEIMQNE